MNKKFLPGAVLFIITFVLGSLAGRTEIYAVDPTDTFYGTGAGNNSTTGIYDSAFGYSVLTFNTTGSSNTAIGTSALYNNTTGSSNTASGVSALHSNTTAITP